MATSDHECEVCEGPATHVCSGLDVPPCYLCTKHSHEHYATCPDVKRGAATVEILGWVHEYHKDLMRAQVDIQGSPIDIRHMKIREHIDLDSGMINWDIARKLDLKEVPEGEES